MTARIRWLLMAEHVPASLSGGGIVRYTVELARALAQRSDLELHIVAQQASKEALGDLIGCRQRVHTQPRMTKVGGTIFQRWVLGLVVGGQYDVIHGVKHIVPRWSRARTILTVHDMLLFDRPGDYPLPKRVLLRRPYLASLRQADELVCVSEATRSRVIALIPEVASKTRVVWAATGHSLISAEPVPVPEIGDRNFVLVVGDASPRKNLGTVISAWTVIAQRRPDALLVLVGPPQWGKASYGPEHGRLVASGHVVHLTGVSDGQLRHLYQESAVVLAPSLNEGFGLPALEALDLGARLVTSDDPALVEVSGDLADHREATDVMAWVDVIDLHLQRSDDRVPVSSRSRRQWTEVAGEIVRRAGGE